MKRLWEVLLYNGFFFYVSWSLTIFFLGGAFLQVVKVI